MYTVLYAGNLSFGTTEQDLQELFGRFGQVLSAQVLIDRETGRSRGYGFVEMADGGDAAIQGLHGTEFQGRTLTVKVAGGRWSSRRTPRPTT